MLDAEGALREAAEIIGEYKGAKGMHRRHAIGNALALVAVKIDMYSGLWDRAANICCPGGVVDCKTGEWLPGKTAADAHHTRLTPVDPDTDGTPTRWLAFLDEATGGDLELIADLRRFAGYTLTEETSAEQFYVLVGQPGTGKTTFSRSIEFVMGDYARSVDISRLTGRYEAHRQWMARLDGPRMVLTSEPPERAAWRSGELSSFVSGETQEANFMRSNSFEFNPVAKLWVTANSIPRSTGPADGLMRRIVPIPFETTPAKADTKLFDQLKAEAPAILAWAVRGLADYRRSGLGRLSASILDRQSEYALEQDSVGRWIAESGEVEECPAGWIASARAHRMYQRWCEEDGTKPMGRHALGTRLKRRAGIDPSSQWQQGERKNARGWRGLKAVSRDDESSL